MALSGLGDGAQRFQMQLRHRTLDLDLGRLTQELSTGQTADVAGHLRGNLSGLAAIERGLTLMSAYGEATAQARLLGTVQQEALGHLDTILSETSTDFLRADGAGHLSDVTAQVVARQRFDEAVSLLNTRAAGRAAFGGDAPDRTPLAASGAILDALRPLAAAAPDAAALETALRDWFLDPGTEYETIAYQGGTGATPALTIGADTRVQLGPDARDDAFREALMGLALGALVGEGAFTAPAEEISAARRRSGEILLSAQGAVTRVRTEIGATEARIDTTETRNAAQETRYEMERTRLLEADPYETATRLKAVETQLEGLYVLTARLSRLTLTEYLR